jgi:hypothetical protein
VPAKTQESARERERVAQNGVTITELEQPTLDDHTAWYLYPQARARAIPAYYRYGPSTNGQCEHGHYMPVFDTNLCNEKHGGLST